MNSQSFSEIMQELNTVETPDSMKSAEVKRKEDLALEKGDHVENMLASKGWQIIKTQLEELRVKLQQELSDASKCDTLQKVQSRQYLLTAIELFIISPKQFIEKRNMIITRRKRWQNK